MSVTKSLQATIDYLSTWFDGLEPQAGAVVFAQKIPSEDGVYFQVVKTFLPTELMQAAEYVNRYDDTRELFIKTSTFDPDKITERMESGKAIVGKKSEVHTVCGFAFDVDAGKKDSYASQQTVLTALDDMPAKPTIIILSGADDHGFHVYWKFKRPITIAKVQDVEILNNRAKAWRGLLVDKIANLLTSQGITFKRDKLVDLAYGVDRVLRPVGALRASGDIVRIKSMHPERRYSLEELTAPGWTPPLPKQAPTPRAEGDSIIGRYFQEMERQGRPITIDGILTARGYSRMQSGREWIRNDSGTGSRSLIDGEVINGLPGINVMSGGCDPLKCDDDTNDVGKRYSLHALWVTFEFGDSDLPASWKAAAKFCHEQLDPKPDEVFEKIDTSGIVAPASSAKPFLLNGSELLKSYIERLRAGKLPQLYKLGSALDGLEIGPNLLTLSGAPPGTGKTALAMQIAFEAMQDQPELLVYVANAEMGFDAIIRRELTRLTAIKSEYIRFGVLTEIEMAAIDKASDSLASAMERLRIIDDPDHESLVRLLNEPPGLVIPDYIQKFAPAEKDVRVGVGMVMTTLRRLANHGHAVLALSATKRDQKGNHSAESLGLSSFRESGECEYQADSAYVLQDKGPIEQGRDHVRKITLAHVKNRHGMKLDRKLKFDMPKMEFSVFEDLTNPARHSEFDEYAETDAKPWRQS